MGNGRVRSPASENELDPVKTSCRNISWCTYLSGAGRARAAARDEGEARLKCRRVGRGTATLRRRRDWNTLLRERQRVGQVQRNVDGVTVEWLSLSYSPWRTGCCMHVCMRDRTRSGFRLCATWWNEPWEATTEPTGKRVVADHGLF